MGWISKPVYVLAFGVLTYAMRNLGEPPRTALFMAIGAVLYAAFVALAARLVDAVPFAPRLWRAALMGIAGTGLATFLFPLASFAILFGLAVCALDVAKHWRPAGVAVPADRA